jgi:hypothetical protein
MAVAFLEPGSLQTRLSGFQKHSLDTTWRDAVDARVPYSMPAACKSTFPTSPAALLSASRLAAAWSMQVDAGVRFLPETLTGAEVTEAAAFFARRAVAAPSVLGGTFARCNVVGAMLRAPVRSFERAGAAPRTFYCVVRSIAAECAPPAPPLVPGRNVCARVSLTRAAGVVARRPRRTAADVAD